MTSAVSTWRHRRPIAFWVLAAVALLVSHDAVFAAQIGVGDGLVRALRGAGHEYWGAASAILAAAGMLAAAGAAIRIRMLRRRAAELRAERLPPRGYLRRTGGMWLRLFALVAVGFLLQENAEHFGSHGHLIGTGALLGPEYPLALPVIALITGLGALLAAILAGTEHSLLATIAAALDRQAPRALRVLARPPQHLPSPVRSVLGRAGAGRAPPRALGSAI